MEKIIRDVFSERFGSEPLVVRSPGRINIIGEHTDYNEGFVLPAAIDKFAYIGVGKREDNKILLHSRSFKEDYETSVDSVFPADKRWANYILGVVDQLKYNGYRLGGFNLVFDGTIPVGAGLSSSAGLECAAIFALNELFSLNVEKGNMVRMAQLAEHSFVGVKCGIMDQFTSMFGKKDYVIKLDCRSLDYEYIPLQLHGHKILLLNTNVKHELISTGYNTRGQECDRGLLLVKRHVRHVKSLRDVTIDMLDKYVEQQDPLAYRRCRYVLEENKRLLQACDHLKAGNLHALGQKMFETHKGLSEDFEVSCQELDFLVDEVKKNPEVLGARMMGGGFGGCTINIVSENSVESIIEAVSKSYQENMGIELTPYIAEIENGTSLVKQFQHATI